MPNAGAIGDVAGLGFRALEGADFAAPMLDKCPRGLVRTFDER